MNAFEIAICDSSQTTASTCMFFALKARSAASTAIIYNLPEIFFSAESMISRLSPAPQTRMGFETLLNNPSIL